MPLHPVFEVPATAFSALQSAIVVGVSDPLALGRVQIRLFNFHGFDTQESLMWARVAVPFAGDGYGAFVIPNKDEEVVVSFLNGDPRYPVIVGSLWHGTAKPSESIPGDEVDRWTFTGRNGSRIAIVEESAGNEVISFTLPGGVSGRLVANGLIELIAGGSRITMDGQGIQMKTGGKVDIQAAAEISLKAPQITVNSPISNFSGSITCTSISTASITSGTYSVGAGNVW